MADLLQAAGVEYISMTKIEELRELDKFRSWWRRCFGFRPNNKKRLTLFYNGLTEKYPLTPPCGGGKGYYQNEISFAHVLFATTCPEAQPVLPASLVGLYKNLAEKGADVTVCPLRAQGGVAFS